MIKTSDNFYVFGQRNKSIHIDDIEFIGGGLLESESIVNCGDDIEKNIIKEMLEEANIHQEQIIDSRIIGILLSNGMNILFIFKIAISINSVELKKQFDNSNDKEMKDLLFVPETELSDFLTKQSSYRPLVLNLLD